MKVTLEFDLEQEHDCDLNRVYHQAEDMYLVMWRFIYHDLRDLTRDEENGILEKDSSKLLEKIIAKFNYRLEELGVDLDLLP